MKCKYLAEGRICRCLASDKLMVPSLFELTVFCQDKNSDCLVYQEREKASFQAEDITPNQTPVRRFAIN